jgi:hypothetical protein
LTTLSCALADGSVIIWQRGAQAAGSLPTPRTHLCAAAGVLMIGYQLLEPSRESLEDARHAIWRRPAHASPLRFQPPGCQASLDTQCGHTDTTGLVDRACWRGRSRRTRLRPLLLSPSAAAWGRPWPPLWRYIRPMPGHPRASRRHRSSFHTFGIVSPSRCAWRGPPLVGSSESGWWSAPVAAHGVVLSAGGRRGWVGGQPQSLRMAWSFLLAVGGGGLVVSPSRCAWRFLPCFSFAAGGS